MKIAIYDPYLDTAGGGEKYMLTIAEVLSRKEQVDILLDEHLSNLDINKIKDRVASLHNLDLSKINFLPAPLGKGSSFLKRLLFLQSYDWIFYLTDGSLFFSTAKNNIIHFQSPLEINISKGLWNRLKLKSWNKAIYNSKFTHDFIKKEWSIDGRVIYPPVSVESFKPLKKKKQILSVGRFFGYNRSKKHDLMIEYFKQIVQKGKYNEWSLHLAGGVVPGDEDYLKELKQQAKGFKVYFYPDIPLADLSKLYGESSIYWHAAGFGEEHPQNYEHFGISTVEAMSAGCVPVVIKRGGQIEIVEDGQSGYLWSSLSELKEFTITLMEDLKLLERFSKEAVQRSQIFGKENFIKEIYNLVYG